MLEFYRRSRVSVRFNDLAGIRDEIGHPFIDVSDPMAKQLQIPDNAIISFVSRDGVAKRNQAIVARAEAHMKDADAEIYIQNCGMAHVFGDAKQHCPYGESLTARFIEAGYDVLPVFINRYDHDYNYAHLPKAALDRLSKGLLIQGLEHHVPYYEEIGDEAAILHKINDHSAGEIEILSNSLQERRVLLKETKNEARAWLAEQGFAAPTLSQKVTSWLHNILT